MTGKQYSEDRRKAGIAGHLICAKTGMSRSHLSDLERGYVQPTPCEISALQDALSELIRAKRHLAEVASANGWPLSAL